MRGTLMASASLFFGAKAWAGTKGTPDPRKAMQFVQDFGNRFVVRESGSGAVRLITEVIDPVRMGAVLRRADHYGVGTVRVSGNLVSFVAGDFHYDVECLDAEAFRNRTEGSHLTGVAG